MKKVFHNIRRLSNLVWFSALFMQVCAIADLQANSNLVFKHLTFKEGLPYNRISYVLFQDHNSFIWIGSDAGLHRFNGSSFKTYYCNSSQDGGLSGNEVKAVFEDHNNNLWIGTSVGLDLYVSSNETFIPIPFYYQNDTINYTYSLGVRKILALPNNDILVVTHFFIFKLDTLNRKLTRLVNNFSNNLYDAVFENVIAQGDSILWIGANEAGLLKYSFKDHSFQVINSKNGLISNIVLDIEMDNAGDIWIGTDKGIQVYKTAENRLVNFPQINAGIITRQKIHVNDLDKDRDGNIWTATDGDGLLKINTRDYSFLRFTYNEFDLHGLLGNKINKIFTDKENNLWLLYNSYGISITNLDKKWDFYSYTSSTQHGNCLSYNVVNALAEDHKGRIWIGTDGGGLNCFDREKYEFTHFRHDNSNNKGISSNTILSLIRSADNMLWIGTYGGGLCRFDPFTNNFHTYIHNPEDATTISGNNVASVMEDNNGDIIVLTIANGISVLNRKTNTFTRFYADLSDSTKLSHNGGSALCLDHEGYIWIGTYYGLNCWDRKNGVFKKYLFDNNKNGTISSLRIYALHEDSYGNLWVGTDNGLNLFDRATKTFRVLKTGDGLINNTVNAIIEDEKGNIWVGTNAGISKIDGKTKKIENYDKNYGLPGNVILKNAAYRCSDGQLLFGGTEGFTSFYPEDIKKKERLSALVIDNLKIFDKSVKVGQVFNGRTILVKDMAETREITLGPHENSFSLSFAVLDYFNADKVEYEYMMQGFDKGWRKPGENNREATYTNLDPGKYLFRVKASSNISKAGIGPVELIVNIKPPWYKTWWAIGIYSSIVVGLFLIYLKILESRMKLKKDYFFEKVQHEKEMETNRMKINFFTNITHEFRTPLTLIMGPLDSLIKKYITDSYLIEQLEGIKRNSKRLLNLINELLDLRKLEEGSMKLDVTKIDLVDFMQKIASSFEQHAKIHNIDFTLTYTHSPFWLWFDRNKMEKVMYNLFSNAFKFTPDGEYITCRISMGTYDSHLSPHKKNNDELTSVSPGFAIIEIEDRGIGVPPENVENIYKKFYSSAQTQSSNNSGIGLSLCKEILDLHHGSIEVENNPEKGACFRVKLLLGNDHYEAHEIKIVPDRNDNVKRVSFIPYVFDNTRGTSAFSDRITEKHQLLIIEDNEEVRKHIASDFTWEYDVIESSNGVEGLQLAIAKIPDLIISDIMMPGMDGRELCEFLKRDHRTSHIPIILLTALAGVDNRINGLQTGADAYISKPYHPDHLRVRVKKLIELRKSLQAKYSSHLSSEEKIEHLVKEPDILSYDDIFLQRAVEVVEKNISDSEFEIEDMCREMGMNYLQLYRKVKALTNMTLKNFILTIRLKMAKKLLSKGKYTIAEVGYEVGFSSPAYFTKCFRKSFGHTPTEFADKSYN